MEFPSPEWDEISDEAKDFVTQLLNRDPILRPTADEALHHPWIVKHAIPEPGIPKPVPFAQRRSVSERNNSSYFLESEKRSAFQKFMANVKVMKTLKTVALSMTPNEAKFLGKVFQKVDKDNDGRIQASDIDRVIAEGTYKIECSCNKKKQKECSHFIYCVYYLQANCRNLWKET